MPPTSSPTVRRHLPVVAAWVAVLLAASPALAQPAPGPGDAAAAGGEASDIDDAVAKALANRGQLLFDRGDFASAKQMFIESLERSPKGPSAGNAVAMLRACNQRLGIKDLDQGSPLAVPLGGGGPTDPYAGDGGPADPYAGDGGGPTDPYGGDGIGPNPPGPIDQPAPGVARRRLTVFGGTYGALLGLAITGPENDQGDIGGAAVLGAVGGAAVGSLAAWWFGRNRDLAVGDVQAIMAGGTWGAYTIALFGDAVTGVGTSTTNEIVVASAIGGTLGLGGGYLWSRQHPSEGDVSLVNSFGAYASVAGLQLGAVMQPPKSEAYSINAMIGAGAGLAIGVYAANRVEVSRARMLRVDLGVLAGAAIPWLGYLALGDGGSGGQQAAGLIALATMSAGGYLGWRLGRGLDDHPTTPAGPSPPADDFGTTTGLLLRASSGRWAVGVPLPRPMQSPALGPRVGTAYGVDLLAGRF